MGVSERAATCSGALQAKDSKAAEPQEALRNLSGTPLKVLSAYCLRKGSLNISGSEAMAHAQEMEHVA